MTTDRYVGQFRPEFSRLYKDADLPWVIPLPAAVLVGVVGDRCSGKSEVTACLEERHGFRVFRVQEYVREEAKRRGVPVGNRGELQCFADSLRAERCDASFLAAEMIRRARRRLLAEARPGAVGSPIVITGLKHEREIELLLPMSHFKLLRVEASEDTRLKRAKRAGRVPQDMTADAFRERFDLPEREGRDSRCPPELRGRLQPLLDGFDEQPRVHNDGESREELYESIETVLKDEVYGCRRRA